MILRYDDKYCQVKEWYAHKQGRGAAAYHVTYDELDTGKQQVRKFGSGAKLIKIEPDKQECQAWHAVAVVHYQDMMFTWGYNWDITMWC